MVLQQAGASLGAAVAARSDLVAAGFGVISDGQDLPASGATAILVPGGSEVALTTGQDVARVLGVPETSVQVDPAAEAIVDVRVALGSDASVAP